MSAARRVIPAAVLGTLLAGLAAAASAQTAPPPVPVTATPLPSLTPSAPATRPVPPPAAATPQTSPAATSPGAGAAPGAAQATTPATPPPTWVPRGTAELQALDKVNARNTTLVVKVGQTATFGSLTIAVQSCVVRPPDQPQDAAAFLVITDAHPDQPGFSGWMLAGAPAASMLENAIYDVRVTGCRA